MYVTEIKNRVWPHVNWKGTVITCICINSYCMQEISFNVCFNLKTEENIMGHYL